MYRRAAHAYADRPRCERSGRQAMGNVKRLCFETTGARGASPVEERGRIPMHKRRTGGKR